MPMDYDDNEFSIHNVELTEEGSSTVSSVLRPYDFEDGGHLSFDSLVENEVFLGITGQEDNQWIEEYSRGTSSSAAESRRDNVWSEATSSESVEMLLKSVGQGTLVTESGDEPGSLATNMDPNLKQDDENNHSQEAMVTNKKEEDMSDEPGSLSISLDPNLKQEDENNHAQEATVTNKEEEQGLTTKELDVSDEHGSLSINLDPNLKQEDENNHAQEATVTNKEEEGGLATEELDVSDEHGSLSINLDPNLKQEDENNHAEETMVTNKEEEGGLATEEVDVSDKHSSLSINLDPNLKQEDGNNHAQEAMITNKEEEGALATEELAVGDEPGSLAINMDPNLKQDDGNNNAQEAMMTNKEVGALASEELAGGDEPGSLAINMDPNLKQDDGNNHAQEAMITNKEVGALVTEELDVSDDPGNLTTNMVPNLKQDDGNNHAHKAMIINKPHDHFSASNVSYDCDKFYVTSTKDSQKEVKVSGGELDSDVLGNKCDLSEEKVDGICHDVNQEARNIVVELSENKLQEDFSHSKIECGSLDASKECNLQKCPSSNEAECSTENMDNPTGSHTAVEACTNSGEKPSNAESLNKPLFAIDISVDEESMPSGSCNLLMIEACAEVSHDSKCAVTAFPEARELNNDLMHEDLPPVAVEDDKTKSENLVSLESNACSPSKVSGVQGWYVEESEKPDSVFDPSEMGERSSINDVCTNMTNTCSSPELIAGNTDLVATPNIHGGNSNKDQRSAAKLSGSVQQQVNAEIQSSEQDGGTCIDRNFTFHLKGNGTLPLHMDIAALDSQQNVESVLSAEGSKAQGSEADITILAEPGGPSPVHHVNEEKKEEGFVNDGTREIELLKVASMVDCASLPVVKTGASPDSAGEALHGTSVVNMNAITNDLAKEANHDGLGDCSTHSTVAPISCDSSAEVGDNVEAGDGMQESLSGHHVNMSIEQHASTDVVPTLECDDNHTRHEEDSSVSMNKPQSVSPLLNTNNTELSWSTRVNPNEGAIDENSSFPQVTEGVVLTSECDASHMRHEEDSSVSMDKLQSVSTELSQSTRRKPSEGAINENTSLLEATKDVPTLECNHSNMRLEEDSPVSMDNLQSVYPLLITNSTELSKSTGIKPSEGVINENILLPEGTEDVVLTSESDYHMGHEEDGPVSMDKLQSVSPFLSTNNTALSQSTGIKPNEGAIDENISLPEAAEDVMLTSECDNSHTGHEEDGSASNPSMDNPQFVSPLLNTKNTELSPITRVKPGDCNINENAPLSDAAEDVVLTSECDNSHTRLEEDSSVSMDKPQSVSPLLNTHTTERSQCPRVTLSDGAINENTPLLEATEDVVLTSECDDSMRHGEDSFVSMDRLQSVSTELCQSTRRRPSEGAIIENTSLPEGTEDVRGKEQSVSSHSDTKLDKSFTFEVSSTAGLRETCKDLQLFPASNACNLSTTVEVPSIDSSSSTLDPRKPNEAPVVTPQTPGSGTIHSGTKERKTRRKSAGRESVRKGKETTTIQPERVEKLSPLLGTPQQPAATAAAAGHSTCTFQELGPKEKVECSVTKPIPISNLPDLNNATCIFHQPFTDNQQVQLRAQILVYGSLISGMLPEEPHMIAAFGQSDAERKSWADAWRACLERAHRQKSQANTPAMQQPGSDLKGVGHRTPDLEIKHTGTLSNTNKGTPPAVSNLIPVLSPLWNMSTPSCAGLQSRSAAFQQTFTPTHPSIYQTPPNPLWQSRSPFLGQWGVASPSGSAASRFSRLPITEAVNLTPVKVSGGGPHPYSMPVVHSTLFTSLSTDGKKASTDSKSRKRKKNTAAVSSVSSQVLLTPPSPHLAPRTGDHNLNHNLIPFLVENQTDSVTAPVVTSIFSTSVTVSTPPASKSSSPDIFLSIHDHPRLGDKKVGDRGDMLLKNIEEGNVQEAGVNATKTLQPSSDSSIKRTKVTTSPAVNLTPISTQAAPVVASLPHVLSNEISLLSQDRTISVTAPALCTSLPTSVAMSTPVSNTSGSCPTGKFPETIYPAASTHGYSRTGYQNMDNALAVEETLSKVKESKLHAENAALLAAAAVSNCQDVWSRLDSQNNSGVVSDAVAKLMSSIAAAATVAKMASAAAKIASNVAEQAKLMADEVFLSSSTENFVDASILKSVDKTRDNHPNSIIFAAREAARRRIEAASAASRHAANLDAILKAAELAAEAVSQLGKIVGMSDSSALRKLEEAGPEGFWKTSQLAYEQHQGGEISGLHLNSKSGKKSGPDVAIEEIQTLKHDQVPPVHLASNQIKTVIDDGSVTSSEKDTRTSKALNLSKAVGVSTEKNTVAPHTYVVGQHIPQTTTGIWEEYNIKEGCLVEVYKEDGKYKGAWLAANVLSLKDEKALVCYIGIQSSDEGPENIKEWVAFEVVGSKEVPRIRIAHPMTTMRFEGARKRCRTAVSDYAWSKGDRVDVWMQDCWREGIVVEPNNIDVTSLTVQFPAMQGETSVRSWHVRPTLFWKDRKWIEWKGGYASQGDMPKEKRMKLGSPAAVNDKRKDKLLMNVEPVRHEEQRTPLPLLSAQENCFNVGKSTDKPSSELRTIQKERARVVFGVPKPGKKQKFMAVSTQYVDDRGNKNNTTNGSFKFSKPPGARGSRNDAVENQVFETKPRLKSRKPPVPCFRTTPSRDSELTDTDSVENSSSRVNQKQVGSSANKRRYPAKVPPPKKAFTFTSKPKSENFNRGKLQVTPKTEVNDKSISQVNEPRRSNRKIQPTSRLLEGLQSSFAISKIPSVSHASQRKVTSKGTGNNSHGSS